MKIKNFFALLLCATFLMSCSNDNPDSLMEEIPNNTAKITYQQNVKSIIDNNCISCHAATPRNGTSLSLVTYAQVKNAIQTRGLLSRISLNTGNSSLMPQGGPRLPQATIDIVAKWEQDGLLE